MQIDAETTVTEPFLSRDHSERMLRYFGAEIESFDGGARVKGAGSAAGA